MMEIANQLRHDIVKLLFSLNDIQKLGEIKAELEYSLLKEESPLVKDASQIRKHVSLEQLIQEQNYKPVTYIEWKKEVGDLDLQESIDDLLDAI